MDEKQSNTRKLSGDKQKKSSKKRRKAKHKDREGERKRAPGKQLPGFKSSSPDETNSDSALELAKRQNKKLSNLSAESRRPDTRRKISLTNANGSTSAPARGTALRSTNSENQVGKPRKISQESLPASTANLNSKSSLDSDVSETAAKMDESLRWDNVCSDPEQEAERIRLYKVNRRKRYLAESLRTRQDKESVLNFAKEMASCEDG